MDNRGVAGWARSLDLLRELDSDWTEAYHNLTVNPLLSGTMQAKEYQLISVGLSAAITHMDASSLRRHIWSALRAGATQAEILEVLKMAAIVALHSMILGAPILIEEAKVAGKAIGTTNDFATPSCDEMKATGQWNTAWDSFSELDPSWADAFVAARSGFYTSGVLTPKFLELISIAFDASISHMYAPGVRRHISAALALGATPEEILTVLKLCVSQGADALYLGVPILAEEAALFTNSSAN
jgi:alkylhydroperoxidase/carboxymuconolactone decarboxylase family protein YurZ